MNEQPLYLNIPVLLRENLAEMENPALIRLALGLERYLGNVDGRIEQARKYRPDKKVRIDPNTASEQLKSKILLERAVRELTRRKLLDDYSFQQD